MTEVLVYGAGGIVALASIIAWARERATWRLSDIQRRLAHWLMASAAARDAADAAFDAVMAQDVDLFSVRGMKLTFGCTAPDSGSGQPERSGAGGAV